MKKFVQIFLLLSFIVFTTSALKAQTNWMTVKSDNGEFSAEVPQTYDFFYDKAGFIVSEGSRSSYRLEKVHIFTSFQEKTLMSFECYETGGGGADLVIEIDKQRRNVSEIKRGAIKFTQMTDKTDDSYLIQQYFRSKNFLYIVTAASRDGETAVMKRFLDSIIFSPEASQPFDKSKSNFSGLKISNVELKINEDLNYKSPKSNPVTSPADPNVNPVKVVAKSRASYIDSARMRGVQGTIALKSTLNSNGFMPKIDVLKSLPEGLLRQAIFAALRMRFLPQETKGIAETIERKLEYNFTIY